MAEVQVRVNGRSYVVGCEDGQGQLPSRVIKVPGIGCLRRDPQQTRRALR